MRLFFIEEGQLSGGRVELLGAEARHMARVLRMAPGERCRVADGRGRAYLVVLTSVAPHRVEGRVEAALPAPDPPRRLGLGQGLPRAAKFDLILQEAAELGAAEVHPLRLARCLEGGAGEGAGGRKLKRWRRTVREASKQCGRFAPPLVHPPRGLGEFLESTRDLPLKLLAWEGERERHLGGALAAGAEAAALLVGPEGGLVPPEVEEARRAGFLPVGLGPRTLRAETVALALIAIVQHRLGDMP